MKQILYVAVVAGLVPIQTTVLEHLSVAGIRPDVCLIAVSLIGFFAGPADGVMVGMLLGLEQDLFSAGDAWINLITKTVIGLLAGVAGRYIARATPASVLPVILGFSMFSGLAFVFAGAGEPAATAAAQSVLLPQAVFDTMVGVGLYGLLAERFRKDDTLV